MSDYIFDWEENSQRMLLEKRCTTKRHQYMELVALIRYLIDAGENQENIKLQILSIDSTYLNPHKHDYLELENIFSRLWKKAKEQEHFHFSPIVIYESEIQFINNMEVLRWVKEYILTMLCVYKYYGNRWCKYTAELKSFCFSMTSAKRNKNELNDKIALCLQRYAPYEMKLFDINLAYRMTFCAKEGTAISQINNPNHVKSIMNLITTEKKCSCCGENWTYSSYNINTDLCPSCKQKERIKQSNKLHKDTGYKAQKKWHYNKPR